MPISHAVENDPEKTIADSSGNSVETRNSDELKDFFRIPPFEPSTCGEKNLLGLGGMGIVYEVNDPALQRKVALKMLRQPFRNNPEQLKKFINEARITAQIGHPNIVAVHQLGIDDQNGAYFSMHRIQGETLQRIIRKLRVGDPTAKRYYTTRRLLEIFIAGCNAVSAAHQKGFLHCDLKPSNIMVGSFGEVWVLDWGLARCIERNIPEKNSPNDQEERKLEGTPVFMAPELISGEVSSPDILTEIYSLGTILYSIISWLPTPFPPDLEKEKLFSFIVQGKTNPISRSMAKGQIIRPELSAICRKAMAVKRSERYQSVGELLNDLHNYMDNFPVTAYSSGLFYRFTKLCVRHPLIPMALTAAMLTMGIFHASNRFVEYTENRSLFKLAIFNADMAEEYHHRFMLYRKKLLSQGHELSPIQFAVTERNMMLSANQAMLEYFAALDAASNGSVSGIRSFLKNGGTDICKQLLKLRISISDLTDPKITLDRCRRRWKNLFQTAVKFDKELEKLISRIDQNKGVISISMENPQKLQRVTHFSPSGDSFPMLFKKNCLIEVDAGINDFIFSAADGCVFSARFKVIPGENLSCSIPDFPHIHGMKLIMQDHFINEISGVGNFPGNVAAYLISEHDVSIKEYMDFLSSLPEKERKKLAPLSKNGNAVVTTQGAMAYCKSMQKKLHVNFRLPYPVELKKAFIPGREPGKTFYNLPIPDPDTPLLVMPDKKQQCRLFLPGKNRTIMATPQAAAGFRIISELK